MWAHLRNRQIAGAKFRRQAPIDRYIVDFLCEKAKVVVELDGGQHQQQTAYEEQRTVALEAYGYIVLRYWNNQFSPIPKAFCRILKMLLKVPGTPLYRNPSPGGPIGPPPSPGGRGIIASSLVVP